MPYAFHTTLPTVPQWIELHEPLFDETGICWFSLQLDANVARHHGCSGPWTLWDWRWMELFRQQLSGDWPGVIDVCVRR